MAVLDKQALVDDWRKHQVIIGDTKWIERELHYLC